MSNRRRPRILESALAEGVWAFRPPPAVAVRTALWFLVVAVLVSLLYATANRVTLKPADPLTSYLWTAMLASAATAVLATLAAFELGQRERSTWWVLLPMPALGLWFAATGLGCVDTLFAPDSWGIVRSEALRCLLFIVAVSLPLSAALLALVGWAAPPRPGLVGAVGGLAIAAAAVSLLTLVHPHNSALLDLVAHGAGVAAVVTVNLILAGPLSRHRTVDA